jgi:hypothetical protein
MGTAMMSSHPNTLLIGRKAKKPSRYIASPNIYPRYKLPQSPIKVFAGGKLKTRNPIQPPATASKIIDQYGSPLIRATTEPASAISAAVPASTPSIPSNKLKLFESPTVNTVTHKNSLTARSIRVCIDMTT